MSVLAQEIVVAMEREEVRHTRTAAHEHRADDFVPNSRASRREQFCRTLVPGRPLYSRQFVCLESPGVVLRVSQKLPTPTSSHTTNGKVDFIT